MLNNEYNTFETEHYLFHFNKGSLAEKDIVKISKTQEKCFKKITELLNIYPKFKINYFLIDTPEKVGIIYDQVMNCNDNEPCNGFNIAPNKIYCVYNENIKCIGLHEDTHIISYTKLKPQSAFLREGLAMFMDKTWKGIKNEKCIFDILQQGYKMDIYKFFDNKYFFKIDCNISYPLAGAFVSCIINNYGLNMFLTELYYTQKDYTKQLRTIFKFKNKDFLNYINCYFETL